MQLITLNSVDDITLGLTKALWMISNDVSVAGGDWSLTNDDINKAGDDLGC